VQTPFRSQGQPLTDLPRAIVAAKVAFNEEAAVGPEASRQAMKVRDESLAPARQEDYNKGHTNYLNPKPDSLQRETEYAGVGGTPSALTAPGAHPLDVPTSAFPQQERQHTSQPKDTSFPSVPVRAGSSVLHPEQQQLHSSMSQSGANQSDTTQSGTPTFASATTRRHPRQLDGDFQAPPLCRAGGREGIA
jgi:hypothetical protein